MMHIDAGAVTHNEAASRFELPVDGELGVLEYVRDGHRIIFTHTLVPRRARGRGLGAQLAAAAIDYAAANELQVVPVCWYVAQYVRERPELRHLLADRRAVGSSK